MDAALESPTVVYWLNASPICGNFVAMRPVWSKESLSFHSKDKGGKALAASVGGAGMITIWPCPGSDSGVSRALGLLQPGTFTKVGIAISRFHKNGSGYLLR